MKHINLLCELANDVSNMTSKYQLWSLDFEYQSYKSEDLHLIIYTTKNHDPFMICQAKFGDSGELWLEHYELLNEFEIQFCQNLQRTVFFDSIILDL